ncbi:MAG: PilZ domain-containing protein [Planctomycetes bacterium]|nr:PilZ domain-containing protein [Planctomycetota bacterium]
MTDNNRPKERRLHPRYAIDGDIKLGVGKEGAALLVNLSMSGLACLSPVAFDEMAILEITMELPLGEAREAFKAGGAVVRCEGPGDGEDRHRVAIFFTHMDDRNRGVLERFLAERGDTRDA